MARYRVRGRHALVTFPGAHKEVAVVLRQAREAGADVTVTGSGHYQIHAPLGVVHASQSPRDGDTTAKRLRRELRKKGLDI